jgi:hypothetical protein
MSERARDTYEAALAFWLAISQPAPNYKALPALHKRLVDAYVLWCEYDLVQRLALHRQYLVSQDYYDRYGDLLQFVCSREIIVNGLCLLPSRLERSANFLKKIETSQKPTAKAWTEWETEQQWISTKEAIMPKAQFQHEVVFEDDPRGLIDVTSGCGHDANALWRLVRMEIGPVVLHKIRIDVQNFNYGISCGMFSLLRVLQEIKMMAVVTGVGSSTEWDQVVDCIALAGKFAMRTHDGDMEPLLDAMLHIVQVSPMLTQAQSTRVNMEWSNQVVLATLLLQGAERKMDFLMKGLQCLWRIVAQVQAETINERIVLYTKPLLTMLYRPPELVTTIRTEAWLRGALKAKKEGMRKVDKWLERVLVPQSVFFSFAFAWLIVMPTSTAASEIPEVFVPHDIHRIVYLRTKHGKGKMEQCLRFQAQLLKKDYKFATRNTYGVYMRLYEKIMLSP